MLPSPSPHRVTISMVKHRQMAHLLFLTAAPGAGARCWVTFVVLPPAPPESWPLHGLSQHLHRNQGRGSLPCCAQRLTFPTNCRLCSRARTRRQSPRSSPQKHAGTSTHGGSHRNPAPTPIPPTALQPHRVGHFARGANRPRPRQRLPDQLNTDHHDDSDHRPPSARKRISIPCVCISRISCLFS